MAKKRNDLTPKEQIFVREYLVDGNGTRAAVRAGYSPKTAHVAGSKLLKKAKVAQELAKLREKLCAKLDISAEKVLQGIAQLAFYDPRKFFKPDGALKAVTDLDDQTVMALCGIDVERLYKHFGKGQAEEVGTISKIKLADRGLNLERLGRHLKLFTDKVEVTDADKVIERLRQGLKRNAEDPRERG
jgi:phage terminase small subunit